jgi:hypothetical protein
MVDFNARSSTSVRLESALSIAKPYVYWSADEVSAFVTMRTSRTALPNPDPKFQGAMEVFYLSDVYFDKSRTLALTGVATWCGMRCGSGQWKIYEKASDGGWKEVRPASGCYSVS